MILQLNPPIPMFHPKKGNFLAHFVHDEGMEQYVFFTGILEESGEIWTFNNRALRGQKNITLDRKLEEPDVGRCVTY